ncbi:MAG TPA: hypothetical protein VEC36_03535 [Patescibacteria group bacterium]|nr:hypothetical protein [Patescibacteria group bacterium]
MLIHFNDLFSANGDGTISPVTHVHINGKMVLEGSVLDLSENHLDGLPLHKLRGHFLEGERKSDGSIHIKSYVRSMA